MGVETPESDEAKARRIVAQKTGPRVREVRFGFFSSLKEV